MKQINQKLSPLRWYRSALILAGSPLASNVTLIRRINAGGTGYISFNPNSNFNSLTQASPGDDLIIEAKASAISGAGFSVDNGTEPVNLVPLFPAGQTALPVPIKITPAMAGTYALPATGSGLTNLSYSRGGAALSGTVTLADGDVLTVTATTGSSPAILTLVKQQ